MKRYLIFLIIFGLSVNTIFSQSESKAKVTYVGNAGFLIKIGDKKILIDALFKGFEGNYILPEHIQEKLINAQAPFDDVDLVLVTHAHGDHINASMVEQHLKNNPRAILASTKQIVDALNARDTIDNFQSRRFAFDPSKDKSHKQEIQGFTIEAFLLPHGPESRIINNGFLISVNGTSFFHTGDVDFEQFTFDEFRSYQLPEKEIDLSFIQHFYLTGDSTSKLFVTKGIGGKYILPIHYHFTTPGFNADTVKKYYPDAILFDKELESWDMPIKDEIFTDLRGNYLGQIPPGDIPQIFAPGIISGNKLEHSAAIFSPDGNTVYWATRVNQTSRLDIWSMSQINNRWTKPETFRPLGDSAYYCDPHISADGNKFYFSAAMAGYGGLWYCNKQANKWAKPQKFEHPLSETKDRNQLTTASNGNLYYLAHQTIDDKWAPSIVKSKYDNKTYQNAEALPSIINSLSLDWTPFIAPDDSYLLFASNRDGKYTDLFISFHNIKNDTWSEAIKLPEPINTSTQETFPYISPDGKYLFFTRWTNQEKSMDIYWVSTKFFEKLKAEFNSKNKF